MDLTVVVAVVVVLASVVALLLLRKRAPRAAPPQEAAQEEEKEDVQHAEPEGAKSKKPKRDLQAEREKGRDTHPLLVGQLKGHTAAVLHFALAPSNKQAASCSEDRTVRVWDAATFTEKSPSYFRVNIELDHIAELHYTLDSK